MGDAYAGSWGDYQPTGTAASGRSQRSAALQDEGWILRSDVIWHKPNPLPESVRDRPTRAHEYVFMFAAGRRYYYDADAVRTPSGGRKATRRGPERRDNANRDELDAMKANGYTSGAGGARTDGRLTGARHAGFRAWDARSKHVQQADGASLRDVWPIATQPYRGAHFATFPEELVRRCVLAGCPEHGTVLDPFHGSGTVGLVARREDRSFVGIELRAEYVAMADRRIAGDGRAGTLPLFGPVEAGA